MPSFPYPGVVEQMPRMCLFLSLCSCLSPCGLGTERVVSHIQVSRFPHNCSTTQVHLVGVMKIDWSHLRCSSLNHCNICLAGTMLRLDDINAVAESKLKITASLIQSVVTCFIMSAQRLRELYVYVPACYILDSLPY